MPKAYSVFKPECSKCQCPPVAATQSKSVAKWYNYQSLLSSGYSGHLDCNMSSL